MGAIPVHFAAIEKYWDGQRHDKSDPLVTAANKTNKVPQTPPPDHHSVFHCRRRGTSSERCLGVCRRGERRNSQ